MKGLFVFAFLLSHSAFCMDVIPLFPGFITKVRCEGRLQISAIGNEADVTRQALPKELGCAVLLQPRARQGKTNLLLETSTGTVHRILEIENRIPRDAELECRVKGDPQ